MVLVVSALIPAPFAAKAGSDRLWQIVNSECMPGQRERGNPAPCSEVNVSKGLDGGSLFSRTKARLNRMRIC
jgi:CDP-diacylglycerol pyrophosphatase